MKTIIYSILFFATIGSIVFSCNNREETTDPSGISGSLTNHSDCKNLKPGDLKSDIADTMSCVNYAYNGSNHELAMKHVNAGFNCCPGKLYCTVNTINDTIIIREYETEQLCNCNCLFDLEFKLQDVVKGKYRVKFVEPYAGDQPELLFEMDLNSFSEGEFCVVRKLYPWGK